MQMFLNKKNLNRISRRSATLIQKSPSYDKTAHSTISTFRQIKQTKKLLEDSQINKPPSIKMENILTFYRHLTSQRKHFSLLSRPKVNFKNQNCQRNTAHDHLYETARQHLGKLTKKPDFMNRTISYTTNHHQQRINSLYEQDPIDLQRDEFKRKHDSLKKYEMDSGEELNQISRNTILSNNLGKLSANQIIEIKERRQMQKDFLVGLTKFGQSLSNEAGETEELREFFTSLPSGKYANSQQEKDKNFDEIIQSSTINDGLDKKVIEKYRKLLSSMHQSELRFPTESYEDYDKMLSSKHSSHRARKRDNKSLINCGGQWRS